ncbi:hypothetical protein CUR95_21230 [Bordetella bronchiseptica]|uniref:Autotransporter outer membrane beta-barrel domain-containing protein n=1 Tax=Bordetella genomosp. 6 TaxID=463024 RepID=A0ABX4FIM8_9BORD|nr:hypothetical protein BBB44_12030 [Bordetella bronchiseptica]AZW44217.1 hypothetical protein CWR61_12130 [Bordetella bronchiseptica]MBN3269621.1 hypothetical protein [Bordetella bronchiseptica]OZI82100.1 hypothetical protein CAL23_10545 [Bordetella genomosp. 6]
MNAHAPLVHARRGHPRHRLGCPADRRTIALARNASLSAAYAGEFGGGNRQHTASAVLRWRF